MSNDELDELIGRATSLQREAWYAMRNRQSPQATEWKRRWDAAETDEDRFHLCVELTGSGQPEH